MKRFQGEFLAAALLAAILAACTGGQETTAQTLDRGGDDSAAAAPTLAVDPGAELDKISDAIPLYAGATFRDDLSRRDETVLRPQYGAQTVVYTLATPDSFPQVWHYYVTYLAQYRAWDPAPPLPPEYRDWRTLEVQLNEAMKDPFIPGDAATENVKRVTLQIVENETGPETLIRYIVTPAPVPAIAANESQPGVAEGAGAANAAVR
jgi:hypothetical protein